VTELLNVVAMAPYILGALAFSALAVSYWRERGAARKGVLPAFTGVCAAAFLLNLARAFGAPDSIGLLQDLVTGLLPALLLHLMWPGPRWALVSFYIAALGLAAAGHFTEGLDPAGAVMLGVAAAGGFVAQVRAPAAPQRRWNLVLLSLTVVCAALNLTLSHPFLPMLPDYLLLAFFAVALYYRERLAFFDVLIKRGVFLAAGLVLLSAFEPWRHALLLLPFWLAAPWLYDRLAHGIDRLWLGRRYSAPEAEREFATRAQAATGEAELALAAEESLGRIFQTRAHVRFTPAGPDVKLDDRPDGVPFLSDDRRLLDSLTQTLGIVVENVRFREREQELRFLAGRAELKALRAQINPHFLFNALNAIAGLIHEHPALAEETVEHLAEVFRYTLRKSEREWARLDEEMEFVAAYLRVEQARFGERLRVELDIDPAVRVEQVPAMSIQPLVENAIKHGVSVVERRGVIRIGARREAGRLRVEVSDNGPGFVKTSGDGHGLRNVADRLRGYYGDAAHLSWENLPEGARVWFEIPEGAAHARPDR
jgi:signal transduction histidine kinase